MQVESTPPNMTAATATTNPDASQPTIVKQKLKYTEIPPLPSAAELLFAHSTQEKKLYWDRSHYESPEAQKKALEDSCTLYVGNLAFSTRSMHVGSHFAMVGPVRAIHMGLDRFRKTPCGFCFVEYVSRADALEAVASLSGTKLDGRVIRVELDAGFQAGRQYGRGPSGGQVRDERRSKEDPARSVGKPNDDTNNTSSKGQEGTYYGAGDKRDRDGGENRADADMEDRPEKNPRFREE